MNYVQAFNIQARRQGKSRLAEIMLRYKLQTIISDIPTKSFVLWVPSRGEEIVWLPTGEVISREL